MWDMARHLTNMLEDVRNDNIRRERTVGGPTKSASGTVPNYPVVTRRQDQAAEKFDLSTNTSFFKPQGKKKAVWQGREPHQMERERKWKGRVASLHGEVRPFRFLILSNSK